jgi:hypothetical protein
MGNKLSFLSCPCIIASPLYICSYSSFHDEVASKVEFYPSAVQAVLAAYDMAVLKYFSVDRKMQMKGKKKVQKVKGKVDGRQTNVGGRSTVVTSTLLGNKVESRFQDENKLRDILLG